MIVLKHCIFQASPYLGRHCKQTSCSRYNSRELRIVDSGEIFRVIAVNFPRNVTSSARVAVFGSFGKITAFCLKDWFLRCFYLGWEEGIFL